MSIAILVTLYAKNTKTVNIVFQTIILMMTFLSGGFSPELGGFIETLARFTVSEWSSNSILHLMLGSSSTEVMQHLLILGGIGICLLAVSLMTYRKVGYHE